jgi:hypothetical protein
MRLGIGDSSSNDTFPTTDWLKASSMGVKFAIIRATTTGVWDYAKGKPTLIEDTRFKDNFAGAVAAGIEVWPYIWFDPRPQLSGEEQAAFFMAVMQKYNVTQRWVFDTEPSGSITYDVNSLLRLQRAMNLAKTVCVRPRCAETDTGSTQWINITTHHRFVWRWNMTEFDSFLSTYGVWVGLGIYVLLKDVIPFLFGRFIPGRIQAVEEARKERVSELGQEREWQHELEKGREAILDGISKAIQDLAVSMEKTNTNIANIVSGQDRMLTKQDIHHDQMMEAIGDMRASTSVASKKKVVK